MYVVAGTGIDYGAYAESVGPLETISLGAGDASIGPRLFWI
jgi:hypothetical protein